MSVIVVIRMEDMVKCQITTVTMNVMGIKNKCVEVIIEFLFIVLKYFHDRVFFKEIQFNWLILLI
jgi:hypothetical protein